LFSSRSSSPNDSDELTRKLRSPSPDEIITTGELKQIFEDLHDQKSKRELIEALLQRFEAMSSSFTVDEVLQMISKLNSFQNSRGYGGILSTMKSILSSLPSHGLAGFSLDAFNEYILLCSRLRIEVNPSFIESMCQRVCAIKPQDDEQQSEIVSYMLRLYPLIPHEGFATTIMATPREALSLMSLVDLQRLFNFAESHDSSNEEFKKRYRGAALTVLRSKSPMEILEDLVTNNLLVSDSDMFKAGLAMAESGLQNESLMTASVASLLLRAWGKQKSISSRYTKEATVDVIIGALGDSTVSSLHSLSRIGGDLVKDPVVIEAVTDAVVNKCKFDFGNDTDNFISIVQSLTLLGINPPEVVSFIILNIDALLRLFPTNSSSFWKLSVWWQSTCAQLPYGSLIPKILRAEFPDVVELLSSCPTDVFVQQVRPRTWHAKTIESVSSTFRSQGIAFTVFPRIAKSPIRAHFSIHANGMNCYVVLMKTEDELLQTSSDARITKKLILDFAKSTNSAVSFVFATDLTNFDTRSVLEIVSRNIVHS